MMGGQHTLQSATIERVKSMLADPEDEAVRRSALQALATLPTTELASPELAAHLIAQCEAESPSMALAAIHALGCLPAAAVDPWAPKFAGLLHHADESFREAAVVLLSALSRGGLAQIVPALLAETELLGESEHDLKFSLATKLPCELRRLPADVVWPHAATLVRLLSHAFCEVRLSAALLLGRMAARLVTHHSDLLTAIVIYLDHAGESYSEGIRCAALVALGAIGAAVPLALERALPAVLHQLGHPDADVRGAVMR